MGREGNGLVVAHCRSRKRSPLVLLLLLLLFPFYDIAKGVVEKGTILGKRN